MGLKDERYSRVINVLNQSSSMIKTHQDIPVSPKTQS